MKRDKTAQFAFVTFLMLNDSYLPGALALAYALRKQHTTADLVCLVTEDITPDARYALEVVFDHVVDVEKIFVPHKRRQQRQDRPYYFTRINALRLGRNGDLGFSYEKIVSLDADVLPLKNYDSLFSLETPAGILNEQKSHFIESDADKQYVSPEDLERTGKWKWHQIYDKICPHGHKIPKEITDRVKDDPANMGLNGSLFVLKPSMQDFQDILEEIRRPDIQTLVGDLFDWPDMQYLTMRWSGEWTSVDVRFSSFNGYPKLSVLWGTHYAGFKPWYVKKEKAMARYARYDDFQLWFREYRTMLNTAYPELQKVKRLNRLGKTIQRLIMLGKKRIEH
jgi:glycogenin glucosyltransferase